MVRTFETACPEEKFFSFFDFIVSAVHAWEGKAALLKSVGRSALLGGTCTASWCWLWPLVWALGAVLILRDRESWRGSLTPSGPCCRCQLGVPEAHAGPRPPRRATCCHPHTSAVQGLLTGRAMRSKVSPPGGLAGLSTPVC